MTKEEIAQLVAVLTDGELALLREALAELGEPDPNAAATAQFLKSLLGRGGR